MHYNKQLITLKHFQAPLLQSIHTDAQLGEEQLVQSPWAFHPASTTSLINTSPNSVLSHNYGERGRDDRYLVIITCKVSWHILF